MKIFKIFLVAFIICLLLSFLYVKFISPEKYTDSTDGKYWKLINFVAKNENLPKDSETILKLASQSAFEQMYIDENLTFFVFRPEYLGKKESQIRNMHGNGNYYIFQDLENEFRLVGKFEGNRYQWDLSGDEIKIKYSYYVSALNEEKFLKWDGSEFKHL